MRSPLDEYLARVPPEQRESLAQLRQTIGRVVPGVEEAIRSGVPAFRHRGRPLVSIGAAKGHVALYVMYGKALETYRDELNGLDTSNTVIRFAPAKRPPASLVVKLVKARRAEIDGLEIP
jgi:uncharacterized protein YdhG (YjbR/CyaY superfamily)